MDIQLFRDEFQHARDGVIHLNHAGVSPISHRCAQAMNEAIEWNRNLTPENWDRTVKRMQACRASVAKMLNVPPEDVALSRNTTEGINWVANGIDWKPGDKIVSVLGEYPANVYPWMRLNDRGVVFKMIPPVNSRVPLERIEKELTPDTRLLTISFVEFVTGFRSDLEALGRLCQEKGIAFLVDLIQGMGVFPLDIKTWNVTFAAGGSQKWLLGPQGAGFFYCAKENLDLLDVTCAGATTVTRWTPYTDYDYTLREDASRFEYGTPATLPLAGLGAAVDLLLEAGMEAVCERVKLLTDILIDGAIGKGYRCVSPRGEKEWSGIVALDPPNETPQSVVNRLLERQIFGAEREGFLRLTPHFYQTEAEMQRVVDTL